MQASYWALAGETLQVLLSILFYSMIQRESTVKLWPRLITLRVLRILHPWSSRTCQLWQGQRGNKWIPWRWPLLVRAFIIVLSVCWGGASISKSNKLQNRWAREGNASHQHTLLVCFTSTAQKNCFTLFSRCPLEVSSVLVHSKPTCRAVHGLCSSPPSQNPNLLPRKPKWYVFLKKLNPQFLHSKYGVYIKSLQCVQTGFYCKKLFCLQASCCNS